MNYVDAFSYPIRRGGWIMIVLGAVFSVILDVLQKAPLFGLLALIFGAGYFGSFYLSIINSTMIDRDEMPEWPDFSDFLSDILSPLLRLIGLVILSFLPAFVLLGFLGEGTVWVLVALGVAVLWGCFYFPMAVMATLAYGGLGAASPHIVLPGIVRAMPGYLLVVVALIVVAVISAVAEALAAGIPYVGWFIGAAVGFYGLMFQGRLIGLLYREKRYELGWD
jgi:hypothetical protein